ncbi:hypothetical protein THAOC_11797 [Thalassiosira oceanica]|uniref:Uncharacterized protein n=1 Tax=Thalassiosira oceanica TaxID=159749 RepID=K0T9L8_THAOC|nr:hypothetical protein THAOC_11797 [Thalassiosira oceanica]|eukprot:EJK67202.1 hypothetical protein THAOC_11797 [Thalassiosira oceanica]
MVLVDVGPAAGLCAAAMRGLEPSSKNPLGNPVKGTARPVVSGGRPLEPGRLGAGAANGRRGEENGEKFVTSNAAEESSPSNADALDAVPTSYKR